MDQNVFQQLLSDVQAETKRTDNQLELRDWIINLNKWPSIWIINLNKWLSGTSSLFYRFVWIFYWKEKEEKKREITNSWKRKPSFEESRDRCTKGSVRNVSGTILDEVKVSSLSLSLSLSIRLSSTPQNNARFPRNMEINSSHRNLSC